MARRPITGGKRPVEEPEVRITFEIGELVNDDLGRGAQNCGTDRAFVESVGNHGFRTELPYESRVVRRSREADDRMSRSDKDRNEATPMAPVAPATRIRMMRYPSWKRGLTTGAVRA
jgi:hypothetical protein